MSCLEMKGKISLQECYPFYSPKILKQGFFGGSVVKILHANAGDMSGAHGFHTTSSTTYYVTFQVESGDRMELHVSGSEYGMLAEGDTGRLTFQGTRYLSFER